MQENTESAPSGAAKAERVIRHAVVRFAGDSGDGMQVTGGQFTSTAAYVGNDLATLPDFPAEIRAPAGTLAGVSAFQVNFASEDIYTPGDEPDVLVAMNPAALKLNLADMRSGSTILLNTDAFTRGDLAKAEYQSNPLEDDSLEGYQVVGVAMTSLTRKALQESGVSSKERDRCKNFFALGIAYWMFGRPLEPTADWLRSKFAKRPELAEANILALQAGHNYGFNTELLPVYFRVEAARLPAGVYRNITGNEATVLGLVAAAKNAGRSLVYGGYPITPASDILHELARQRHFDVRTIQCEDEIASVCAAIGASYGGALGCTASSGPGIALKQEAVGLATMVELPLVVINVQRGGPSTGLPTKTEQADLLQALYGRNGECPVPVVAPASAGECFELTYRAVWLATRYMCPVFVLTDGYLANGSEPWRLPDMATLSMAWKTTHAASEQMNGFAPYDRDEVLSRPWAVPGTPGLEHRIGGLEKQAISGNVSYDPANHQQMVEIRAAKIDGISQEIPEQEVEGDADAEVLVVGWGSTHGALTAATEHLSESGHRIAHAQIRYLNPLPRNTGDVLRRFKRVFVFELNGGQLVRLLRERFLVDCIPVNKVQGQPFKVVEIEAAIKPHL